MTYIEERCFDKVQQPFILISCAGLSCPPGYYAVNLTACTAVPAYTYNPYANSNVFYSCKSEIYAGSSECVGAGGNCPAGTYFKAGYCVQAPPGAGLMEALVF